MSVLIFLAGTCSTSWLFNNFVNEDISLSRSMRLWETDLLSLFLGARRVEIVMHAIRMIDNRKWNEPLVTVELGSEASSGHLVRTHALFSLKGNAQTYWRRMVAMSRTGRMVVDVRDGTAQNVLSRGVCDRVFRGVIERCAIQPIPGGAIHCDGSTDQSDDCPKLRGNWRMRHADELSSVHHNQGVEESTYVRPLNCWNRSQHVGHLSFLRIITKCTFVFPRHANKRRSSYDPCVSECYFWSFRDVCCLANNFLLYVFWQLFLWEGRCWPKSQNPHSRKRTGEFSPFRHT